ncbi:RbsD/FucU family protein [Pararhizobium antarcticum]|uniref:Fucose-binding protein n=1 Tax=Pararhizobium antarcticum TaxID=1798805 RepID=A0A657LKF4_9HYPH|nr:RbsD/FucU family protein [Pararhizobium antarcticum]OJF90067.1 fucose-binding protein [Pararhizobium antarcticum]
MLKNLDPALSADVLHALRSMGHGDSLVIADANFPSESIGRHTSAGRVLGMDNISAARAVHAVLSIMPLDTPLQASVGRMEVTSSQSELPEVQLEVQAVVDGAEGRATPMYGIERFAFYELSKKAYCILRTGERRFYGCFLLTKGVIPPTDL